jgi:hypothetical protein
VFDRDFSTGQDGDDGVVKLADHRVGVLFLPRGKLIVDPPVIRDSSLVVDDEGLGGHRRAELGGE